MQTVLLVPPEFVTTLVNHTDAILQYAAMIPDYITALNAHTNALNAYHDTIKASANANTSIRSTPTIVTRKNKKIKVVILSTPTITDF